MKKFLIITGGSSGIGFATAKIFKDDGFEIINLSRSSINLDKAIHIEVDLSTSNWQKSLEMVRCLVNNHQYFQLSTPKKEM